MYEECRTPSFYEEKGKRKLLNKYTHKITYCETLPINDQVKRRDDIQLEEFRQ